VLDEAHRFLPAGADTAASRACGRIAREGRKYGVGLMAITQRPSDVDLAVLSQCGTMIALRVTNGTDRGAVNSTVPDDLGGLTALLPSLRTGEGLVLGEALQVPSRVRIDRAPERPVGDDQSCPTCGCGRAPTRPAMPTRSPHGGRRARTLTPPTTRSQDRDARDDPHPGLAAASRRSATTPRRRRSSSDTGRAVSTLTSASPPSCGRSFKRRPRRAPL
jgi:DNA helicase HerA-like ATPase